MSMNKLLALFLLNVNHKYAHFFDKVRLIMLSCCKIKSNVPILMFIAVMHNP